MKLPQLLVLLVALVCPALESAAAVKKIVFIAGKPSHGPLQHEHRAGSLLLQKCLADFPGIMHIDPPGDRLVALGPWGVIVCAAILFFGVYNWLFEKGYSEFRAPAAGGH